MPNRVVNVKMLPGEPLDGTGRVCIHLFVRDEAGKFVEPHVLHPALDDKGEPIKNKLVAAPTRGRLACDSKYDPAPAVHGKVVTLTLRTDDCRAVSCPKCIVSADYIKLKSLQT